MEHRHRVIAGLMVNAFGGGMPETADIPARPTTPVNCEACKHHRALIDDPSLGRPGDHCYMFDTKPGPYCAQFRKDTSPAAQAKEAALRAQIEGYRQERLRRKAENFAKHQPKGNPNGG